MPLRVACAFCGGPTVWTIVEGVQWTACRDCCSEQGELFGLPSLNVKEGEEFLDRHWEPPKERKVVPPEGGDARDD